MKRTSEQMYPLVEAYQKGTDTQDIFCARHQVSKAVLNYWQSKYNQDQKVAEQETGFRALDIQPAQSSGRFIEIRTPGGLVLSIPID